MPLKYVIFGVRVSTEAASSCSVLWSVKHILMNRQKSAVTRKFTIQTSTSRATYAWTFWGLLTRTEIACFYNLQWNQWWSSAFPVRSWWQI